MHITQRFQKTRRRIWRTHREIAAQLATAIRPPSPIEAIKVGKRLVIAGKVDFQTLKAFVLNKPRLLVIPASAAFGAGEHATTAMSLRLLERLTREWKNSWSLADLGTGSGILALAAKRFGAGRLVGIDIDPKAISIAKANALSTKSTMPISKSAMCAGGNQQPGGTLLPRIYIASC